MRNFIYQGFIQTAQAPTWQEIMGEFRLSRPELTAALRELDAKHDVVLLDNQTGGKSDVILMSHPFSNIKTPHSCVWEGGTSSNSPKGWGDTATRYFGN